MNTYSHKTITAGSKNGIKGENISERFSTNSSSKMISSLNQIAVVSAFVGKSKILN